MTKPELKTLTETTMKYLQALEDKQNAEFDRKILAERVVRLTNAYENLSRWHTGLLVEYGKLQLQIEQLTCLSYRAFNNN